MSRTATAVRFVAVASAIYLALLLAAPARASQGAPDSVAGPFAQALSDLAGSPAVALSMALPLALAVAAASAQAVNRAATR